MEETEEVKALHEKEVTEGMNEDLVMARVYINDFDNKMIADVIELSLIEGKKEIFLNSAGGLASAANILVHLINSEPDKYVIKICEQVMSATLLTILNVKCPVEDISNNIGFYTTFLHHNSSRGKHTPRFVKKQDKITNENVFSKIKHVLTDKQLKYYRRCLKLYTILPFARKYIKEDLFLTSEQMAELLGDRYTVAKWGEDNE